MSNNVFYRHYRTLHDSSGLPDGIETFTDYLGDNFKMSEDEAFADDFESIAEGVIETKLAYFGVEIEWEDQQSPRDMKSSEDVFKSIATPLRVVLQNQGERCQMMHGWDSVFSGMEKTEANLHYGGQPVSPRWEHLGCWVQSSHLL